MALLLALSDQRPLLYSDSDVLAFNPPTELLDRVETNTACYFLEEVDGTRDPFVVEQANRLGLRCLPRFNSGLLYVPRGALPANKAALILSNWKPPAESWFAEQTVLSVMFHNIQAEALPNNRYVISTRRQFYWEKDVDYRAIAARHFTGTVRHLMYKYGMPELLRQSVDYSKEEVSA